MMCWILREEIPEGEYRLALNASDQQRLFGKGYFYLPPVFNGQEIILPSEPAVPQLLLDNRELINSLKAQLQQANVRFTRASKASAEATATHGCVPCLMAFHMSFGPLVMIFIITNGFEQWDNAAVVVVVIFLALFSATMLVAFVLFGRATYLISLQQKERADWLGDLATIIRNENAKWSDLREPYYLRIVKTNKCGLVYISFTNLPLEANECNEYQDSILLLREQARETEAKIETIGLFLTKTVFQVLCFFCIFPTLQDEVPEGEYRLMINATEAQEMFGRGYTCFPNDIPEFDEDHRQLLASLMVKLQEAKSHYDSNIQCSRGFWMMMIAITLFCTVGAVSDELGAHFISKAVIVALLSFCLLFAVFKSILLHKVIFREETSKWIEEVVAITNDENQRWPDYHLEVVKTRFGFFYISFISEHVPLNERESFTQDQQSCERGDESRGSFLGYEQEVDECEPRPFTYPMELDQAVSIV